MPSIAPHISAVLGWHQLTLYCSPFVKKNKINGELYRAYTISDLPKKFGTDNLTSWFVINELGSGHAGLTLIHEDNFNTWG